MILAVPDIRRIISKKTKIKMKDEEYLQTRAAEVKWVPILHNHSFTDKDSTKQLKFVSHKRRGKTPYKKLGL